MPDLPHRAPSLHVDMRGSRWYRQRARESPLAAVVTTAHTPGFLDYSIGAQCYCGPVVGPGKPLEAIFSACSLIDAPLLGLFLRPGSFSQMGIGGVAWRVVSDGSEGLCWALTTAPDRLLL